jgi:Raf kinase inhibitor-like YbhB/YbcL family protein
MLLAAAILTLFAVQVVRAEDRTMNKLRITSAAFPNNGMIPPKFTCDGADVSTPLSIVNVPEKTRTLALIVDDPDAPAGTWVHWVVWNISPGTKEIPENSVPQGAVQGTNDFGKQKYGGPCPPSGTHRYYFKLYALDASLALKPGATKGQVEEAMKGHILGHADLIGLYRRK